MVRTCSIRCCLAMTAIALIAAAACTTRSGLERLSDARRLASDLEGHFTRATDAANRAVMADTDEASVAFAGEAEQAAQAVERDAAVLKPLLQDLGYQDEARLLFEFDTRFAEYRALDRTILELAVENTNLKAQRLSFGPAAEAADAFRKALEAVNPKDAAKDNWRVRALVATAVSSVQGIQVLQAPHIAEAGDAGMTGMEERMKASEAAGRATLATLGSLVSAPSRPQLTKATSAFDRFMALNAQIVALSRRNTNVRSLALSLNDKGKRTAACEESLRALRDALAARDLAGTR
jgi:hypothetical protein